MDRVTDDWSDLVENLGGPCRRNVAARAHGDDSADLACRDRLLRRSVPRIEAADMADLQDAFGALGGGDDLATILDC